MKSIWIPLALCASIAQMPTASAAQQGHPDKPATIEQAKRDLADAQANLKALLKEQKAKKVEWTTIHESTPEVVEELKKAPSKGTFWSYSTDKAPTVEGEVKVENFFLGGTGSPTGHHDVSKGESGIHVQSKGVWIDEDGNKGWTIPVLPQGQHEVVNGLHAMPHDFHGGEDFEFDFHGGDFDFSDIEKIMQAHGGQGVMRVELHGDAGKAPSSFNRTFRLDGGNWHETQGAKSGVSKQKQAWITIMGDDNAAHGQHLMMGGHGNAPQFMGTPHGSMKGKGGPSGHPIMGGPKGAAHGKGMAPISGKKGGNACPECGGSKAVGQGMDLGMLFGNNEGHGGQTLFGTMENIDGHEIEVFFRTEAMPQGGSFFGGKKDAFPTAQHHEEMIVEFAEIADCEAAPSCCDCECSANACEGDLEGQAQNFFSESSCEETVAIEIEVCEETIVCEETESSDTFVWATDADSVDMQIDALINELGGDHAQTEVRVIRLTDMGADADFNDIDALIAELEGDLASIELEALLADLESEVVTLEIDTAKVNAAPVVVAPAVPAKPAVDAKIAALESKVADLEAIIESLVKELNQR